MSVVPPGEGQSHRVATDATAPVLQRLAEDADHRTALRGPVRISVWVRPRIEALVAMETLIEHAAPTDVHLGI